MPTEASAQPLPWPVTLDTAVTFLGWRVLEPGQPGQTLKAATVWRIEETPQQRLAIFMHLLAPDGTILAQFDGLDVASDTLQPGDVLIQLHELALPAELPQNTRWLNVGMYYPDSQTRLLLSDGVGDRLLLPLTTNETKN